MKITIQMTDEELGEALRAYLAWHGLVYRAHEFVDDNALQVDADVGAAPAPVQEPAPVQAPASAAPEPKKAAKPANPGLSFAELMTYDPSAVEEKPEPDVELASVLAEMAELPPAPPGLPPRRR